MVSKHHVLLIGIDAYQGGNSLDGCVNDIDAIQRILIDGHGIDPGAIKRLAAPRFGTKHETDVPEALPTRENVLRALEELGSDSVGPGDRVFIYYSGHGTQLEIIAPSGERFFREALVPSDRLVFDELRYLFDWEVNALLARIAARTTSVSFILDACCSAGATRGDFNRRRAALRFLPAPEPYVLPAGAALPPSLGDRGLVKGLVRSVQACQVVTACQDDERAQESEDDDGLAHGELTRALIARLRQIPASELPDLRWGRIWRALIDDVKKVNPAQHLWMSGDIARRVFGGPPEIGDVGYGVTLEGDTYHIDAGSLLGVSRNALLAVYGPTPAEFPERNSPDDIAARQGLLRITRADRTTADAVPVEAPFPLPAGARARLIKAGRDAALLVALDPPDAAIADKLSASGLVEIAEDGTAGDITLVKRDDGSWVLTDDVFGTGATPDQPVLIVVPPAFLKNIVAVVEHYHDYAAPLRLAKSCTDLPGCLVLTALDCTGKVLTPEEAQTAHLPEARPGALAGYEMKDGEAICFRVENTSSVDLRVALIDCQMDGTVFVLGTAVLAKKSSHLFWADETLGQPFPVSVAEGHDFGVDRLVAIGTTNRELSFDVLNQSATFAGTLRGAHRNLNRRVDPAERWTSAVTTLRMIR